MAYPYGNPSNAVGILGNTGQWPGDRPQEGGGFLFGPQPKPAEPPRRWPPYSQEVPGMPVPYPQGPMPQYPAPGPPQQEQQGGGPSIISEWPTRPTTPGPFDRGYVRPPDPPGGYENPNDPRPPVPFAFTSPQAQRDWEDRYAAWARRNPQIIQNIENSPDTARGREWFERTMGYPPPPPAWWETGGERPQPGGAPPPLPTHSAEGYGTTWGPGSPDVIPLDPRESRGFGSPMPQPGPPLQAPYAEPPRPMPAPQQGGWPGSFGGAGQAPAQIPYGGATPQLYGLSNVGGAGQMGGSAYGAPLQQQAPPTGVSAMQQLLQLSQFGRMGR